MKMREYKTLNLPPLTDEEREQLVLLANTSDEDIDLSDIPEITPEQAKTARRYYSKPLTENIAKKDFVIQLDEDLIATLQAKGDECNQEINTVLRKVFM